MNLTQTKVEDETSIKMRIFQVPLPAHCPRLSVHLVTWNGAKYMPYLFASLRAQTFWDWELLIWDNASTDNTVAAIEREVSGLSVPHTLHVNETNIGFSGGHNALYARCESEYFLLLNQDMYLASDCLAKLVEFLNSHPEAAAVTPRLMRWDFGSFAKESGQDFGQVRTDSEKLQQSFTNYVDSLGLKVFRNRRVVEWMTGEEWGNESDNAQVRSLQDKKFVSVFGVSGAFPMYRRGAIQAVAFQPDEFFDSLYHSYKEDVDLAWRLQAAGWQSYVLLDTVAYHDRSAAGPRELADVAACANKKIQSSWVKYHSYKNHLMTLYKNEYWQNFTLDWFWILWYEWKKFVWFLLFDKEVLKGLGEVWNRRRKLKDKRSWARSRRKVHWKALRTWWTK